MLSKTSPKMRIMMLVNVLLLAHSIPLVQSSEISVPEMILKAENSPIIAGARCTSRTLSSINAFPDSTNVTTDDDGFEKEAESVVFPPYCPEGYFCDLSANGNEDSFDEVLGLCKACSGSTDTCIPSSVMTGTTPSPESLEYLLEKAVEEECQEQCGETKNRCSSTMDCSSGLFCNFEDGEAGGYCEVCPSHFYFCEEEKNLTSQGLKACHSSCMIGCNALGTLGITTPATAATTDETTLSPVYIDDVNSFHGSPQLSATGPIVDCGLGLEPCEGVEGSVCFIERGKAPFVNKTRNCHAGGGIAAVIYNLEASCDNIDGTFFGQETLIPSVSLTHMDAKAILDEVKAMPPGTPLLATVEVGGHDVLPEACILSCMEDKECEGTDLICNFDNGDFGDCKVGESLDSCNDVATFLTDHLACTAEREYCDYSTGGRGYCRSCPEKDGECFFSSLSRDGAKECNSVCTDGSSEQLESAKCKFCAQGSFALGDIGDGFESTVIDDENSVATPCEFCASSSTSECSSIHRWDMEYPKRTISMFGSDVECWRVAEFYRSLKIDADSSSCSSARSFNYICGCSDTPGYAGANSDARRKALVWFPRVGAILSILGSLLMIIGVVQDGQRRQKVIGELIIVLCAFDIIGSLGYAFASYATPTEDYIYGAEGNEASCTAQGFFIQIGTISLYTNVSIAFYYLLIIEFSWREHRLKKSWVYYMLFGVPILVGGIFAFAGIPFYDNAILWCNNSRKYWSEIPVAVAIIIATGVMLNLCWFVFKSERASKRFRRHSNEDRASLANAFFKQSLVYLGAFYLTWPPYLALQIMIANGYAFDNYKFTLIAGTLVTLQGFWNYVFHIGLNGRTIGKSLNRAWTTVKTQAGSVAFSKSNLGSVAFSKSNRKMAKEKAREENVPPL